MQTNRNITDLKDFTKTLNVKVKKTSPAKKEKAKVSPRSKSESYRNSSTPTNTRYDSLVTSNKSNTVINLEDDDLIPPTPSPAGHHSFINCQAQWSSSSTKIQQWQSSPCFPQAGVSKDLTKRSLSLSEKTGVAAMSKNMNRNKTSQDKKAVTKVHECSSTGNSENTFYEKKNTIMDSITLDKNSCHLAITSSNKEESVVTASSCNSVETSSTLATSRKKYKLSRKPKLPKVVSSPLKKHDICGSIAKTSQNSKQLQKEAELPGQEESTSVIAPSKCVVLRSRMKRPATKGSSPLQKRLQTDLPLSAKVLYLTETSHECWT